MATLPNSNIDVVPAESPTQTDPFPALDPINTFDLVGPTAANRQPNALKQRDFTLRDRVNLLIANMNKISTGDAVDSAILFLPRDGSNPMTGDLDMGGKKFTNYGVLLASPTSTPDDYVQVSAGTYQKTNGKGQVVYAGGSVQITTPVGGGQTRYDLVHINDSGTLSVTQGVAGTPGTVPDFPDDELTIAVVKVDETGTIVVNAADITDVRPFLSADQNARTLQGEPIDDTTPNSGDILQYSGSQWAPSAVVTLPTNYIGGLITSNNGTDALHDVDIAKGQCRDVADATNMVLSAVLTKQIDGLWVVGDDQPGLDAGAVAANTLYALWLIKRTDTGVVDAIFSTSFTTPVATRIPDYDAKRLIGAVMTDGSSDIIAYVQSGDYFRYMGGVIEDVNDDIAASLTWYDGTLSVPPDCMAHVYGYVGNAAAADTTHNLLLIRTKGAADGLVIDEAWMYVEVNANSDALTGVGMTLVDSSRKVQYATLQASGDAIVRIHTFGFTMLTRREP